MHVVIGVPHTAVAMTVGDPCSIPFPARTRAWPHTRAGSAAGVRPSAFRMMSFIPAYLYQLFG